MVTATAEPPFFPLAIEPQLTKAVIASVHKGLVMCGATARCVGLSEVPPREGGNVTGMIGVHGRVSGFVTVSMSEQFAIATVEGLLQDKFDKLTSQVIDGVGEITNIIVGGIKGALANSNWAFPHITVPSVILGDGYQIAYARGLTFICATFERQDSDSILLRDRLLQVSVSLLRL